MENVKRLQDLIEEVKANNADLWIWYPGGIWNNPTACYSSDGPAPEFIKNSKPGELIVQSGVQMCVAESACPEFLNISCVC